MSHRHIYALRLFLALVAVLGPSQAVRADHALTQDGTGIFNVSVELTATTWSRPLRVRWQPGSFEYDYDRHQILQAKSEGSSLYWVADVVTTESVIGKEEARALMRARQWDRYIPPPPRVVILPTPTPVPTAAPTTEVIIESSELADQSLPVAQRLEKQREIFLNQQQTLAEQIRLGDRMHMMTEEKGKELRKKLLERQLRILRRFFPADNEQVQLTISALEDQLQKVEEKGKFSWEF
ncbi:MAG: hypothetical protein N2Z21_09455 [Candidatus Sumerlaeaceae bacterium]|nr:hypothetical protein [Candidatus Sumerlaeaceae bacterium]